MSEPEVVEMGPDQTMDVRIYYEAIEEKGGDKFAIGYGYTDMEGVIPYALADNGFWLMDGEKDYFVAPAAIVGMVRLDQVCDPDEFEAELGRIEPEEPKCH